jgi:hypothetical protein
MRALLKCDAFLPDYMQIDFAQNSQPNKKYPNIIKEILNQYENKNTRV